MGKEYILKLYVSVNDLFVVAVFQSLHQLHYDFASLSLRHPTARKPLPVVEQLPARQVLHNYN